MPTSTSPGPSKCTGELNLYTFQASSTCTVAGKEASQLAPMDGSTLPDVFS